MKAKMILILTAVVFFFSEAHATKNIMNAATGLSDALRNEIAYPDHAAQNKIEGIVLVSFSISETGAVHIDEVNYSQEELRDYVIGKISSIHALPGDDACGKTYSWKFIFRLV